MFLLVLPCVSWGYWQHRRVSTYVRALVRVRVCVCVRLCVRVCVRVRARACVRACARASVRARECECALALGQLQEGRTSLRLMSQSTWDDVMFTGEVCDRRDFVRANSLVGVYRQPFLISVWYRLQTFNIHG